MRKFITLVRDNFRGVLIPLTILGAATFVIQVFAYAISIMSSEYVIINGNRYFYNRGDSLYGAVNFLSNGRTEIRNTIMGVSFIALIMLMIFFDNANKNRIVINTLPVRTPILCLAKLVQVALSVVFMFFMNYGAVSMQYVVYSNMIPEQYRNVFIAYIDGYLLKPMRDDIGKAAILILVFTAIYSYINYIVVYEKKRRV